MTVVRVLIAPTSFGDDLTAAAAAAAVAEGWRRTAPDDELDVCPLSDGNAGLVESVRTARGGRLAALTVTGPLGEPVPATLLLVEDDGGDLTAYADAAEACGLHLLPAGRPSPMSATSAGVAELLLAAASAGASQVVLGLGGVASHDAGAGLLAALGAGPVTALGRGGGALADVSDDVLSGLAQARERLAGLRVVGATDTDVPLLGLGGASATAASGRGATPRQAQQLEAALGRFAHVAQAAPGAGIAGRDLLAPAAGAPPTDRVSHASPGHGHHHGSEAHHRPSRSWAAHAGAGAGGGLGFALLLLGAQLRPGPAVAAEAVDLSGRLAGADLVVTGEAVLDGASLQGSMTTEVTSRALAVGVPVVVVAWEVELGRRETVSAGIEAAYAVHERPRGGRPAPDDGPDAMGPAAALADRSARVARTWSRRS